MAVLVSIVHSVAMITAGGFAAWLVYRYLGLKFVSQSWYNLDAIWASSLILVGALSLSMRSVEVGWQVRLAQVLEHALQLGKQNPARR
jgi:hypothetical protein